MGSVRFILTGPISCWLRQCCKQKRLHAVEFISWKSLDRKTIVKQSCLIRAIVKAGAVVLVIVTGAAAGNGRPTQPNVVLLLTDDLGWQDVKCYDIDDPSPMETPNIDALAKQGVMFWQAYAPAPTCAPTRCAIMSGNHPARAQKTHVVGGAPPAPYNRKTFRMMPPWYSGRMPEHEVTLARVLQQSGYVTGHSGKWHMAINHNAFPQPEDQGFVWTRSSRGSRNPMQPHRLTGFATGDPQDPYRLDSNGFPYHQNSEDALTFLREYKARPFFLYYATWLVHTPIHTRSEALLDKYCRKLGVTLPDNPEHWAGKGQTNPFYCAMVEELDYHVGRLLDYLNKTADPRWPGHSLRENTYVIFTSDNGGMEQVPNQIITDNYPLDRGKISAMEGGTRVPLIITGPGIEAGVQTDVMVNGLDFYPTILSLTGTPFPQGKHLDGCDLAPLLKRDPTDAALIRHADGSVRETMVWHFPHSVALESTIRMGDYKLIRNYDHVNNAATPELELYRLYKTENGKQTRVDIEEANNLAHAMPDRTAAMNQRLTEILTEMKASTPYYNPQFAGALPHKDTVCTVLSHEQQGDTVTFTYRENGARVVRANLIYTLNGGHRYEEWFRKPAALVSGSGVSAQLPAGTTHYFINLIDENNFLVSYPEAWDAVTQAKQKKPFSTTAIKALP
ncbi:MAG: sulfatase [Phycisphaerae bacterium]|nr:sulfatase [Phycisphaerae bacterium]